MSWKSLQQQSLAHGMLIDHKALHELDEVDSLLDWTRSCSYDDSDYI